MALSDYDGLFDAVLSWTHRNDIDELIPDFIALTEQEFYNPSVPGAVPLQVREMEKTDDTQVISTVTRGLQLPTDYHSMRSIRIDSPTGGDLIYQAPEQLQVNPASGRPVYFTVTDEILFDRVGDSNYPVVIRYLGSIAALTSTNTTNTILTNYPSIYLYGCLHQAFLWAQDDQQAALYQSKFINAISGANRLSKAGRYGPAPSMRVEGATP